MIGVVAAALTVWALAAAVPSQPVDIRATDVASRAFLARWGGKRISWRSPQLSMTSSRPAPVRTRRTDPASRMVGEDPAWEEEDRRRLFLEFSQDSTKGRKRQKLPLRVYATESRQFTPPDRNNLDVGSGMGGVNHHPIADIHCDMVGGIAENHQVARL